jgi:two-component sensor histidine kinase
MSEALEQARAEFRREVQEAQRQHGNRVKALEAAHADKVCVCARVRLCDSD